MICSIHLGSDAYEEIRYPAGEFQIRIRPEMQQEIQAAARIQITADLRAPEAIIKLGLLRSAIAWLTEAPVRLIVAYLPYARADRRFVKGDCHGLAVYATLINGMGFSDVVTLDAHSFISAKLVWRLVDAPAWHFIEQAIGKFNRDGAINVLLPDEGAMLRYAIPDRICCNTRTIQLHRAHCKKKRDPVTGALSGFEVPGPDVLAGRDTLLVDDICDGGLTFLGVAQALEMQKLRLGLYVTHGIFSRGYSDLREKFEVIYTTDSAAPRPAKPVWIFGCTSYLSMIPFAEAVPGGL